MAYESLLLKNALNMFFPQNLLEIRRFYLQAWQKKLNKDALSALEAQICQVITQHPEYQRFLQEDCLDKDFKEANPFFHMGLHLAVLDQIQLDKPQGIRDIYQKLMHQYQNTHEVEHRMMDILQIILWQAQEKKQLPDEQSYLRACQELCHG